VVTRVIGKAVRDGKTSYYIDDSNILRGADRGGGTATASDKPVR
jgi:hypothetical protein